MKTQTGKAFTVSEEMAAAVSVIKISVPRVTAKSRSSEAPKDVRQENGAIKSGDAKDLVSENRIPERATSEIEKPETERQNGKKPDPKQTTLYIDAVMLPAAGAARILIFSGRIPKKQSNVSASGTSSVNKSGEATKVPRSDEMRNALFSFVACA